MKRKCRRCPQAMLRTLGEYYLSRKEKGGVLSPKLDTLPFDDVDFRSIPFINEELEEEKEAHEATRRQLEETRKKMGEVAAAADAELTRLKGEISNLQLIELGLRRDIMTHTCVVDGGGF